MTVFGYSTLKDQNFLPPQLGGSGDVGRAWEGFPYSAVTESVKRYYLLELSYHAHSLVFHLFTVHRNDFVEMTLHHICAVALVIFSYFANWVRVGALVLFLHDIADVTAYAVKAVVDTRYTALTLSCYGALLAAWGYTRLYVFPFFVISKATVPVAEGESASFAWITSYAMLLVLQGLHIYWYTLFLIMGYRFAISGKTVDIQQKAGSADGSYVDYHKTHIKDEHAQEQQNGHHKEEQEWQQEEQQPEQSQLPTKRTNKQTSSKKKGKSKRAE
jgi:ceramide synthetase